MKIVKAHRSPQQRTTASAQGVSVGEARPFRSFARLRPVRGPVLISATLVLLVLTGCTTASASKHASTSAPVTSPNTAPTSAAVTFTKFSIPPTQGKSTSIDGMLIDQMAHRLYIADRTDTGVDVFDVSTPEAKYMRTIQLASPPNGLALAPDLHQLAAGMKNSAVAVISIANDQDKVVANVPTGGKGRTDGMAYDPDRKIFIAVNGDDGFVTLINANNDTVTKKIDMGGAGLEVPAYNAADKMFYMNGSDKNVVFQIDPALGTLANTFPVGVDSCDPHGIAIDSSTQTALLGCRLAEHTVLWDLKTHSLIKSFDQAGAGEATLYDAKADRWFFGARHYFSGPVIGIFGGSPPSFLTAVSTTKAENAGAVAYDETNRVVYSQDEAGGGILSFPLPNT